MKTIQLTGLFAALVTCAFQPAAYAQPVKSSTAITPRAQIRSGVTLLPTGGVGIGAVRMTGAFETEESKSTQVFNRPVFQLALLSEIGRGAFTFQTGLMYFQEGFNSFETVGGGGQGVASYTSGTIHYLGLPLLAKFNMRADARRSRFTVKAGVVPVYTLSAESERLTQKYATDMAVKESSESGSVRSSIRDVNVIGQVGAGYEIQVAPGKDLRIEAAFNHSLLGVLRDDVSSYQAADGSSEKSFRTYTQSFLISVALGFDI